MKWTIHGMTTLYITASRPAMADITASSKTMEQYAKQLRKLSLKEFFHGSAHARVLRNLICVLARNKANFLRFYAAKFRRWISSKKISLSLSLSLISLSLSLSLLSLSLFTHRRSEIILFGSYFNPALDFSFILLFLRLTFLKVINFQMWLIKSRAT